MVAPNGTRYPNHVMFKEITPPSRLVFDHGNGERIWFVASIDLQETDNGTLITIRQTFPSKLALNEVVEKYGAIEGKCNTWPSWMHISGKCCPDMSPLFTALNTN